MEQPALQCSAGVWFCSQCFAVPLRAAASASATQADQPPAALVPTDVRLGQILADHEKAFCTPPVGVHDSVVEHWALPMAGMNGVEDLQRDGTTIIRNESPMAPFQTNTWSAGKAAGIKHPKMGFHIRDNRD